MLPEKQRYISRGDILKDKTSFKPFPGKAKKERKTILTIQAMYV
jgi:hypothetical protein